MTDALGPLRVLLVSHVSNSYGAGRSLLTLAVGLQERGWCPIVIVPGPGTLTDELEKHRVEVVKIECPWWAMYRRPSLKATQWYLRRIVCTAKDLVSVIQYFGPTLVHTSSSVIPSGALAASMSGLPHVWHLREVVSRDTGLNFLIGRTLSLYLMGTWSRALIAVSRSVARMFTFGPTRRIMHVVYNGIDLPPGGAPNYPATVHAATKSEQPVLILVGLLQPEKGQTEAIRALSELSRRGYRCQLRLVGADTFGYGARLHALCDELRVDEQVIFTGHLSDPLDEIMRADVVLNCSPSEGFGRVTVEAMLLGKPVIGTNTGGTPEIIKDGRTGLLYRQGDPVHLADRIAELLANPTQAAEMGPSARQAAQSRFSVEQYVDGVEAIYRRILANETVFAE